MNTQDLLALAHDWLDDDPDAATRAELESLITLVEDDEDQTALVDLAHRFAGTLAFGTAGLRGRLGAGSNRMNRVVVLRAAAGLTAYLMDQGGEPAPVVVIGYDARHNSDVFALDTAAAVVGAGGRALLLPTTLPTPVLAFAIRHLGADAGVMVTASHNPPEDNGYKVYLGDGSQIVPPADADIAAHIDTVGSVRDIRRAEEGWEILDDSLVEAYLDAAQRVLDPHGPRDLRIAHTSLHGVGHEIVTAAFAQAGFPPLITVADQADPDPDFPTVAFPNPEEPGAMDAILALADEQRVDVAIANDPDADRCAVAVRDAEQWRMLRGDEVGTLLGDSLMSAGRRGVMANSIVSSRFLATIAAAHGVPHQETLTGFKWIARVPGLEYGYEEALGYCTDPNSVADKDGVTAALVIAEMAAGLAERGRTLLDRLDELESRHGVHRTDAFSVRVADLALIPQVMERLRLQPPAELGGVAVVRRDDLSTGMPAEGDQPALPPTDGLRWYLADDTRVIARPSGTEPKLKVYLEAIVPLAAAAGEPEGDPLRAARAEADRRLAAVRATMEDLTRI